MEEEVKHVEHAKRSIVVAIVSAILGSTGGPFVLTKFGINPYRTDPATGTEIRLLEEKVGRLENHVNYHPDATLRFDTRITVVETNQQIIIRNQERIMDKLDAAR